MQGVTDTQGEHWITLGANRIKLDDSKVNISHVNAAVKGAGLGTFGRANLMRQHQTGQIKTRRDLGHAIAGLLTIKGLREQDRPSNAVQASVANSPGGLSHKVTEIMQPVLKEHGWSIIGDMALWQQNPKGVGSSVIMRRQPDNRIRVRVHNGAGNLLHEKSFVMAHEAVRFALDKVKEQSNERFNKASEGHSKALKAYQEADTPENAIAYAKASREHSHAKEALYEADSFDAIDGKMLPPPVPNREKFPFVGQMLVSGIHVLIESMKGDIRSGVSSDGKAWSVKMGAHYGEIANTKAADKDAVDCYVMESGSSDKVYIINQLRVRDGYPGAHDEYKVIFGCYSPEAAKSFYLAQYDDPRFFGGVKEIAIEEFQAIIRTCGKQLSFA